MCYERFLQADLPAEKRDDAAEADCGDGANRVQSHVPLRLRLNDGHGRIRGSQFG